MTYNLVKTSIPSLVDKQLAMKIAKLNNIDYTTGIALPEPPKPPTQFELLCIDIKESIILFIRKNIFAIVIVIIIVVLLTMRYNQVQKEKKIKAEQLKLLHRERLQNEIKNNTINRVINNINNDNNNNYNNNYNNNNYNNNNYNNNNYNNNNYNNNNYNNKNDNNKNDNNKNDNIDYIRNSFINYDDSKTKKSILSNINNNTMSDYNYKFDKFHSAQF